jgi:hypothetical protein
MSEMVERVAKAMALADGGNAYWKPYMREARAAIEAMREPTDNMKFVASNTSLGFSPGDVADGWRLMIDEALK